MKELKLLDDVLRFLKDNTVKDVKDAPDVFNEMGLMKEVPQRDKFTIMRKLVKDGYAELVPGIVGENAERYYLSYEGLIFINKCGYIGQLRREKQSKCRDWIIIGVTISVLLISAFYYCFEIYDRFQSKNDTNYKQQEQVQIYIQ